MVLHVRHHALCNVFALLCPGLHCTRFQTIKVKLSERGEEEKTKKRERRTLRFFFSSKSFVRIFNVYTNFFIFHFLPPQWENSPKKMLTIRSTTTRFHDETTFTLERLMLWIFDSYVLYDMPHETWTCSPLLNSKFFTFHAIIYFFDNLKNSLISAKSITVLQYVLQCPKFGFPQIMH
jgi:hypothetical protein